jgi:predicted ribosomally synthesized peptide with nif11-like leader
MSMKNFQEFMRLIQEDPAVARRVKEIGHGDFPALIWYARELNLEIGEDELSALKESSLEVRRELSDMELDSVSGGWFFPRDDDGEGDE